jgi:hypothetical protein
MHEHSIPRIEEFRGWVKKFRKLWKGLLIRASWSTVQAKEVALYVNASLETVAPSDLPMPAHNPTVKGFTAIWEPRPSEDIDGFLDDLKRGVVRVAGHELHVGFFDKDGQWVTDRQTFQGGFYKKDGNYVDPQRLAGASMWMHGAKIEEVTNQQLKLGDLKNRWNVLRKPFRDGEDVVTNFFQFGHYSDKGESAFVGVLASLPIYFKNPVDFDGESFSFGVTAPATTNFGKLTIGEVITRTDGQSVRRSSRPPITAYKEESGALVYRKTAPARKVTSSYVVLRYDGVPLDERKVENPSPTRLNPAIELHKTFDPDLKVFEEYLFREEKLDHAFEYALSWLMAFCGLPPMVYGPAKRLRPEIDLCVYSPAHHAVIGLECTIDQPNIKEKMSKLYHRCQNIQAALPDYQVIPAVASRLKRNSVPPTEVSNATKNNVALLTEEKLRKLLLMAKSMAPTADVLNFIVGCVPDNRGIGGGVPGLTYSHFGTY